MDLDDFIMTVFCLLDDLIPVVLGDQRLRQRGPAPTLADSEVLTMEVVGTYLQLPHEAALFAYFRQHYRHFFPAVGQVHRTTFVRQAANLWKLKEVLWQALVARTPHDPTLGLIDSYPLPVCAFARARRCQTLAGEAGYGRDPATRGTFYGLRVHLRLAWPGVITAVELGPANVHDLDAVPSLVEGTSGLLVGDRIYWAPALGATLRASGVLLLAPFRQSSADPHPRYSATLRRIRVWIETVFGQLTAQGTAKKLGARDLWHLANRLLRRILLHTIGLHLNLAAHRPPHHFAQLVR